jgi:hypothetical protein
LATIRVEESSGPHGLQNPAIVACIQKLADKIFCTYVLLENEAEEEIKARHQHMLVEPPDRTAFRQSLGVGEHLDSLASLHCFGKNHGLDSQKNVYKSTGGPEQITSMLPLVRATAMNPSNQLTGLHFF